MRNAPKASSGEELWSDRLAELLSDISDDNWRQRISASLLSIEYLFEMSLEPQEIWRTGIAADELWTAAVDELVLDEAKDLMAFHSEAAPPVTVVLHGNRYYLFMGSLRALTFALADAPVDSIVADVTRARRVALVVQEATVTLRQFLSSRSELL